MGTRKNDAANTETHGIPDTPSAPPVLSPQITESLLVKLTDRIVESVLKELVPKLEASIRIQPRWLSIETAAAYIDKTYEGMRYTLKEYPKELPVVMVGGKPRIDIKDIDRFMLNRKPR